MYKQKSSRLFQRRYPEALLRQKCFRIFSVQKPRALLTVHMAKLVIRNFIGALLAEGWCPWAKGTLETVCVWGGGGKGGGGNGG